MILRVGNPKESTKKLLALTHSAKLQDTRLTHKDQLYISNKQSKNEIKKTVTLAIVSKRIKHLKINLGGAGFMQ